MNKKKSQICYHLFKVSSPWTVTVELLSRVPTLERSLHMYDPWSAGLTLMSFRTSEVPFITSHLFSSTVFPWSYWHIDWFLLGNNQDKCLILDESKLVSHVSVTFCPSCAVMLGKVFNSIFWLAEIPKRERGHSVISCSSYILERF